MLTMIPGEIFVIITCVAYASHALDIGRLRRATVCYGDLGCFQSHNSVPVPQSPNVIRTSFDLYRQGEYHSIAANNFKSHLSKWTPYFDSSKNTKVVIHGFLDNGHSAWISKIVRELQKKDNFNIIVVNWGHGSTTTYEHAAGNTYLVGAELAQFLTYLHDHYGLQYNKVHLVGHSLGAQISGHAGHQIHQIARISGLDPADPYFTGEATDRRLDAGDAAFVDVIHTDASKYVLIGGYGTHDAVGTIDFYPNGGEHQPGCSEQPITGSQIAGSLITGSLNLANLTGIASSLTCSHSRSRDLFIESINSKCRFYGHGCRSSDSFENGQCLGCPTGGCPIMGYNADQTRSTGVFFLSTSGSSPYCGHEYFVEIQVSDRMLHTYGEFIITLVGTHHSSEPLKFDSLMQAYDHGDVERHVVSTHTNLGRVRSVKLEFVKASSLAGVTAMRYIKVYSVTVKPADGSFTTKICGHEHRINSGQTVTMSSHSGC